MYVVEDDNLLLTMNCRKETEMFERHFAMGEQLLVLALMDRQGKCIVLKTIASE